MDEVDELLELLWIVVFKDVVGNVEFSESHYVACVVACVCEEAVWCVISLVEPVCVVGVCCDGVFVVEGDDLWTSVED